MVVRHLTSVAKKLGKQYPILTLMGPRQAGKTTLARTVFSKHHYLSLEDPELREFAQSDPKGFLKNYSGRLILDEIQRVPELFSYLQVLVDEKPQAGQFILIGSQQLLLNRPLA